MARFPLVNVKIWKCTPEAYDVSSVIQSELKELAAFLGAKGEVRLFRTCEERLREVYRNAPRKEELGFQSVVGFADAVCPDIAYSTPHHGPPHYVCTLCRNMGPRHTHRDLQFH